VELALAWRRVAREVADGMLGGEFDRNDRVELQSKVRDAEEAAKDEVWGGYRYAIVADTQAPDGLKVIDLGAGHSSSAESLCDRVLAALKSEALLNESVGAGYIERNWPPALRSEGAWPLASLRQSFLNGSLTRLVDPDAVLKSKIVEFVMNGDFGLASGKRADGSYERVWFKEAVGGDEVAFESGVFLLRKARAEALRAGAPTVSPMQPPPAPEPVIPDPVPVPILGDEPAPSSGVRTLRVTGNVPPEVWNRLGTRILPKLRTGSDLKIGIDFSVSVSSEAAPALEGELRQILQELGLSTAVQVE